MELTKLLYENPHITNVINKTIVEYDIASAATTAIRYIYGEAVYNDLMKLDKKERNIKTGMMQRSDPELWPKIEKITLSWFNMFIEANKIDEKNIIETTRDSIVIVDKIPTVTSFDNGIINFRNKDGVYTSYYRVNDKKIFFDSMNNEILIKGINKEYVSNSLFVKKIIIPLLTLIEKDYIGGPSKLLTCFSLYKHKYLEYNDTAIYRSLTNRNLFRYLDKNNEIIESEVELNDDSLQLLTYENYIDYILPLIRMII